MKFSIVIPSYNQGEFLERTLLSIINQEAEVEIIVIDGGSTDDSVNIIKRYGDKIAYWVSEKDRGQAHALNKGFAKATGDIFGWQNSDDVYCPGAFSAVTKLFEKMPEKKIIYGNWYEIDEHDAVISAVLSAPRPRIPHFSYEGFDANIQAMFWRKEVHARFGIFDEQLHQLMDTDFLFSVMLRQGIDIFQKTEIFLGSFRRYVGQKTQRRKMDERALREQQYIDSKYGFSQACSLAGVYYRGRYYASKLWWMLQAGGKTYMFVRSWQAFRKRGRCL
jgi:glycosyltransferase involved in cell wall biosynthesis